MKIIQRLCTIGLKTVKLCCLLIVVRCLGAEAAMHALASSAMLRDRVTHRRKAVKSRVVSRAKAA